MQQIELIHKRNHLLYSSYLTFFIVHCVCVFLDIFQFQYFYQYSAIGYFILIGLALFLKVKPQWMQYVLISSMNGMLFYLAWQSSYIYNTFWIIVFLLLVTVYKNHLLNIILSIIVFAEIIFLLKLHPAAHFHYEADNVMFISIFLFFILLSGVTIQTFYIRNVWNRVEQQTIQKENDFISREAYLHLFFEQADDAISVFDLEGRLIEANPAFERLYGWKRDEEIGKILPIVPPSNRIAATSRIKRLLNGESFTSLETQDMKKDGTVFDVQLSLSPIYNRNKELIALSVISRDISYIKENERLIVNAEKLKLAGEIAAGVAHEIRNPMTVISGFVQMMNMDDDSPYKDYTSLIQMEIERIDLIISEFLILSRPQLTVKERFNIIRVVDEIATLYQYELQNNKIELQMNLEVHEAYIQGNRNQIKQVLINILKNAMEAIHRNGRIKIDIATENDVVLIFIRDDGVGIPAHIMKHIFEPFYTTKTKGTGLGMMITNKIVQDHEGDIKISSKEDVGTDVCIRLPLVK